MSIICVTTIVKDEEARIERWAESAVEADLRIVADTGSSDRTVEACEDLGVGVEEIWVSPFRFDTARNAGLALIPPEVDVVVTLDADEVLVPGWRAALEKAITEDTDARRWSYEYVWSWVKPGVPDVVFTADRCVSREGWMWHGAVHEVLVPAAARGDLERRASWGGFRIEHYADDQKSRGSYLELLQQAVREEPHNPRQLFYLAREYFFVGRWEIARNTFIGYLDMPEARWAAERAEAYRYVAKMDDDPERWLLKAVAEDPGRRDAVVDLVDLCLDQRRYDEAAGWATRALRVETRPGDYMTSARVWDDDRLHAVIDREEVFD